MRADFVVHVNESKKTDAAGKPLEALVTLRPVVNEETTNREWSPNGTPSGELKLLIRKPELIAKLREGARLELEIKFPPPAATAAPPSSGPVAAA